MSLNFDETLDLYFKIRSYQVILNYLVAMSDLTNESDMVLIKHFCLACNVYDTHRFVHCTGFLYYSIYEIDTSIILSKLLQNNEKRSTWFIFMISFYILPHYNFSRNPKYDVEELFLLCSLPMGISAKIWLSYLGYISLRSFCNNTLATCPTSIPLYVH